MSPTLFNIYVAPLARVVRSFSLEVLSYADDTQIMITITESVEASAANFKNCMQAVASWMVEHYLRLNGDKTEILIFGEKEEIWSEAWWPDTLGPCPHPGLSAKNLGIIVDTSLSLGPQINRTVSTCFGMIRPLKKIFQFLSLPSWKQAVVALVLSRLDYCNALYVGINKGLLHRLQLVQNAAARLVMGLPKFHSVPAAIRSLHWLPLDRREGIKKLFRRYVPGKQLRSSSKNLVIVPRFRKSK